jgi:hypothetical protein
MTSYRTGRPFKRARLFERNEVSVFQGYSDPQPEIVDGAVAVGLWQWPTNEETKL